MKYLLATLLMMTSSAYASTAYVGGLGGVGSNNARTLPKCSQDFNVREILRDPTETSIKLQFHPGSTADYRVGYGLQNINTYTAWTNVTADTLGVISITGLSAGTDYVYRLECKATGVASSRRGFRHRSSFRTFRAVGETVRFALSADSHIGQILFNNCNLTGDKMLSMRAMAQQIVDLDVDFFITLGDEINTHATSGLTGVCTAPSGKQTGGAASVTDQDDADARYEMYTDLYAAQMGHKIPFFLILGNHEGESTNWGTITGEDGYWTAGGAKGNTNLLSEAARLKYLTNPDDTYMSDGAAGNLYTFNTGALTFIALDTYKFNTGGAGNTGDLPGGTGTSSTTNPVPGADEWDVDAAQRTFITNALTDGDVRAFRMLASHQQFHGVDSPHNYGRGHSAGGCTDNGLPTGASNGEQQWIEDEMVLRGGQLYLNGHDHLTQCDRRIGSDGNPIDYYACAVGQPWGDDTGSSWAIQNDVVSCYDFNIVSGQGEAGPVNDTGDIPVNYVDSTNTFTRTDSGSFTVDGIVANSTFAVSGCTETNNNGYLVSSSSSTATNLILTTPPTAMVDATGDTCRFRRYEADYASTDQSGNARGTLKNGYFIVTVTSTETTFEWIRVDWDEDNDVPTSDTGDILFTYRVPQ